VIDVDELTVPALAWLGRFLRDAADRLPDTVRAARAAYALIDAGVSPSSPALRKAALLTASRQQQDGGMGDPEETAWSAAFLARCGAAAGEAGERACAWLRSAQRPGGGWGRSERDVSRIPTTALVAVLAPSVAEQSSLAWLQDEWRRDLRGPVQLTYKAGFFLLAMGAVQAVPDATLVEETILHLSRDRNDDGGFGPWRGHPAGSDPWSTGVVLWGLAHWAAQVDATVLNGALEWLGESRLRCGVWPYHYLDDGASLALLGIHAASRALKGEN